jgi:general secretion pathway protein F
MQYRVRTFAPGEPSARDEVIEAADVAALRASLQGQGRMVLDAKPVSSGWRFKRQERGRFALFCRELRTLVRAGMTVVEAVETLSARERSSGGQASVSAALLVKLQQGQALSAALASLDGAPAVLVAAVRAGERTSNLAEALDDFLRFDELVEGLRRKVISAAIYPALVTALGIGISVFLLLVVMPNFARMYQSLRGPGSGASAWMIRFSVLVSEHQGLVFGLLACSVAGLAYWAASGKMRRHGLRTARAVPWIRARMEDFQLAMLYQALALLLKGGYPMLEAMAVASQSALSDELQNALKSALADVERGGSVSQALAKAGLCDEVGRRLMAAAERNGDFHLAADVVSRLHGERFGLFVERTTRIVEPALLMAVSLMVGTIVVMMYLPIFDMWTRLR